MLYRADSQTEQDAAHSAASKSSATASFSLGPSMGSLSLLTQSFSSLFNPITRGKSTADGSTAFKPFKQERYSLAALHASAVSEHQQHRHLACTSPPFPPIHAQILLPDSRLSLDASFESGQAAAVILTKIMPLPLAERPHPRLGSAISPVEDAPRLSYPRGSRTTRHHWVQAYEATRVL